MSAAHQAAASSIDPSKHNGAVLAAENGTPIHSTAACNQFPAGVNELPGERWERPAKYQFIEHAERNAIYRAARQGIPTEGLVLVCPWSACTDCARAIIQSGIVMLVRETLPESERWAESI